MPEDSSDPLEARMAPYAMRASLSRGRVQPDHGTVHRGLYQRDRDRIVHCAAFRRLQYKTQVFISVMEGDYFRNRLTHTLEVTQIARTVARALALNEDLVEAVALSHDLGHGPFGHSGEAALNEMMAGHGGFDHNAQGLRIVDGLEHRYARFDGLNLTYETREGYAKNYVHDGAQGRPRSALGFAGNEMPSLEVQLTGHADEIAYDTHDLDDGLVSGSISEAQVRSVELWRQAETHVLKEEPRLGDAPRLRWHAIVRRLISVLVIDLIEETLRRIRAQKIATLGDVRACPIELAGFSTQIAPLKLELEDFLMTNFYRGPNVNARTNLWNGRLKQLFKAYLAKPDEVPADLRESAQARGESFERTICDYVAGMTDRFCAKQWELLVK